MPAPPAAVPAAAAVVPAAAAAVSAPQPPAPLRPRRVPRLFPAFGRAPVGVLDSSEELRRVKERAKERFGSEVPRLLDYKDGDSRTTRVAKRGECGCDRGLASVCRGFHHLTTNPLRVPWCCTEMRALLPKIDEFLGDNPGCLVKIGACKLFGRFSTSWCWRGDDRCVVGSRILLLCRKSVV